MDVHVSVFVDRMLRIDDREYEFEVRGRGSGAKGWSFADALSAAGAQTVC